VIASKNDKENPFSFIIGQQQVVPALEALITSMLVGEKAYVELNSDLLFDGKDPTG